MGVKLGFAKYSLDLAVEQYLRMGSPENALLLYIAALRSYRKGSFTYTFLMNTAARLGLRFSKTRISSLLTTWRTHRFIVDLGRGVYRLGPCLIVNEDTLRQAREKLAPYFNVDYAERLALGD